MVRVYKRKTNRSQSGSIPKALELMESGSTLRKAANEAGVNFVTLSRRWKNKDKGGYQKPRMVFSAEAEQELQDYLITCSRMSHGLTPVEVRKLAYQYATANGLTIPESWQKATQAGKDWLKSFMNRSGNLSIRKPEATSLGRATSFNKHNVCTFFKNLNEALSTNKIQPGRIWNMDEMKVTTVHKPPKVVGDKKVKQLGQVTSAERGVLVTGVCCVSSSGANIPPTFIWPRKTDRNTEAYMRGTPTNSLGLVHESGWMTAANFEIWMAHFIKHVKPTTDDPVLLLLDNHQSHMNYKAIKMAKENGVAMLTFPPHTTHRLQPLDVSVYGPYQTYYNVACNGWQLSNPGKTLGLYNIGELAGKAMLRVLTPENITNGFKKTGIYPMDENVFSEADFLPSAVTDRAPNTEASAISRDDNIIADGVVITEDDINHDASLHLSNDPQPSTSTGLPSTSLVEAIPKAKSTPADLRPFPKAGPRKVAKRCQTGASTMLTNTPNKNKLEQLAARSSAMKKGKSKALKRKLPPPESDSSENEGVVLLVSDSDDEYSEDDRNSEDNRALSVCEGSYVVVRYTKKTRQLLYVGIVASLEEEDGVCIKFLKKTGTSDFMLPEVPETDAVDMSDIIQVLPNPNMISGTSRCNAKRKFAVDLSHISG